MCAGQPFAIQLSVDGGRRSCFFVVISVDIAIFVVNVVIVIFILGSDMLVVVLCIVIVVFVLLTIAIAMNGMTLVEVRWLSVLPLSLWLVAVDRCWKPGSSNVAMVGVLRLRIINFKQI